MMNLDTAEDLLNFSLVQAASPVLFCSICNKPFSQETALKRHVAYCRRARSKPRVRPKPCIECRAAKSKCNLEERCTRCVKKGLVCSYSDAVTVQRRSEPAAASIPMLSAFESIGELNLDDATQDTGTLYLPTSESQDWNSSYNIGRASSNRNPTDRLAFYVPNGITVEKDMILSGRLHEIAISGMVNDCTLSSICEVSAPLSRIQAQSAAVEASANVIRQSLAAYPQMMLRRSTFPPFIHPHQDKSKLPVPLANCMGIAVLFAARNKDTSPFLWKTIWDEQERSLREMAGWSKYDVFAAMQSQLIYIMMRVVDGCCGGEAQDRDYNTKMLLAYKGFWSQLIALDVTSCNASVSDTNEWEDWVLEESLARIACVWFLVAQISSVRMGMPCGILDGWHNLRLPCHQSQWTAKTSDEWKEEVEALSSMRNLDKRPMTFGDLYELNKGVSSETLTGRLDVWNAGVDNLGVLLNVAVNMI